MGDGLSPQPRLSDNAAAILLDGSFVTVAVDPTEGFSRRSQEVREVCKRNAAFAGVLLLLIFKDVGVYAAGVAGGNVIGSLHHGLSTALRCARLFILVGAV